MSEMVLYVCEGCGAVCERRTGKGYANRRRCPPCSAGHTIALALERARAWRRANPEEYRERNRRGYMLEKGRRGREAE